MQQTRMQRNRNSNSTSILMHRFNEHAIIISTKTIEIASPQSRCELSESFSVNLPQISLKFDNEPRLTVHKEKLTDLKIVSSHDRR